MRLELRLDWGYWGYYSSTAASGTSITDTGLSSLGGVGGLAGVASGCLLNVLVSFLLSLLPRHLLGLRSRVWFSSDSGGC